MAIFFFNEDIDFHLDDEDKTSLWLERVLKLDNFQAKNINYIFCSDSYIHQINLKYLNHDSFTDIITFDNSEEQQQIEADIFISIDRVRDNAQTNRVLFDVELHRVLVHGVLHIMGFADKTNEESKAMREKEDACLSLR